MLYRQPAVRPSELNVTQMNLRLLDSCNLLDDMITFTKDKSVDGGCVNVVGEWRFNEKYDSCPKGDDTFDRLRSSWTLLKNVLGRLVDFLNGQLRRNLRPTMLVTANDERKKFSRLTILFSIPTTDHHVHDDFDPIHGSQQIDNDRRLLGELKKAVDDYNNYTDFSPRLDLQMDRVVNVDAFLTSMVKTGSEPRGSTHCHMSRRLFRVLDIYERGYQNVSVAQYDDCCRRKRGDKPDGSSCFVDGVFAEEPDKDDVYSYIEILNSDFANFSQREFKFEQERLNLKKVLESGNDWNFS